MSPCIHISHYLAQEKILYSDKIDDSLSSWFMFTTSLVHVNPRSNNVSEFVCDGVSTQNSNLNQGAWWSRFHMWVSSNNPLRAWVRKKNGRKINLSLFFLHCCFSLDIFHLPTLYWIAPHTSLAFYLPEGKRLGTSAFITMIQLLIITLFER